MTVSRVDMKTLDSPASTILVTNSEGARYAITVPLCETTLSAPDAAQPCTDMRNFAVLARNKSAAASSDADDAFTPDQGQECTSFREKVPIAARSASREAA